MTPAGLLWIVGAFVLAIGLLVTVHELGHYSVARLCGVKILRFSVGFGRPLLLRRWGRDGTEWVLAAFPLGGYVKMLDEREGEVPADALHRAFNRQSLARRSLIVAAGPLANLLLAVLLYALLFMTGVDEPRPILAAPPAQTPAALANVGAGETVRAVSGEAVNSWNALRWVLLKHILDRREVTLDTIDVDGHLAFRRLDLRRLPVDAIEGDVLAALGLHLKRPVLPPRLGSIQPGSPAERAGLQVGDLVVAIDTLSVEDWHTVARTIQAAGEREIVVQVERAGRRLDVSVTPTLAEVEGQLRARIGIGVQDDPQRRRQAMVVVRYGAVESLMRGGVQTWETAVLSLRMIGRMLLGELSVKNISGPVTIADYAGQSARMGGEHYLRFLALISISLGVLNLLPIPVLDGGHLMYYLAEFIKGGPLSERAMEIGQQIGLLFLGLLMSLAFYNDINRLITG